MSTQTVASRSTAFTIGWITLLVISALATFNHIMLPAYGDDIGLAIGWTGYSLYATMVFSIPFRRGERWAWYTSWILMIGFAAPILFIPGEGIAVIYLIIAGVMALCLLLTRSAFFQQE
jgi:hypothetical protein